MTIDTRQKIRFFQLANNRPVNMVFQTSLPADVRILLGSLLLEEVLEYCQKGLGLELRLPSFDPSDEKVYVSPNDPGTEFKPGFGYCEDADCVVKIELGIPKNDRGLNAKEIVDGLADVDVVNHFNAHWHGFNLNYATHVANESNMTKLDDNGEPIINGVTPGYEGHPDRPDLADSGFDPTKPVGKILKSKNFREPDFGPVIAFGNPPYEPWDDVSVSLTPLHDYAEAVAAGQTEFQLDSEPLIDTENIGTGSLGVIMDSAIIEERAKLPHCVDHPDQTTANCEGGYGLAGGGVGSYYTCGKCGAVFGKTQDSDEE